MSHSYKDILVLFSFFVHIIFFYEYICIPLLININTYHCSQTLTDENNKLERIRKKIQIFKNTSKLTRIIELVNEIVVTRGATYLDVELKVFVHLVDVGEDISNDARNDPLEVGALHDTLRHTYDTM